MVDNIEQFCRDIVAIDKLIDATADKMKKLNITLKDKDRILASFLREKESFIDIVGKYVAEDILSQHKAKIID